MSERPLVELRGVSRAFGRGPARRSVLDQLDLRLDAGEFAAIVGRSGSGKSTLLHLLGGLDVPDSGQVLLAGQDIARLPDAGRAALRRSRIGFVFQDFNLVPTLSVLENLLLPLQLAGRPLPESRARCESLLAEAGLAGLSSRAPETLSGGEQQRLAVLRAVVHEPELVLADEPTGNLDLDTAQQVLDLLQRFAADGQRTLVMVTHSPEVIGRARRVLRMERGRLVEGGQPP
ncbi:MAG: ABC transporter ATP-binding protein [Chromatiales bacterium]|nr:ABC transporter ATP-binding protein [Chromatiales bacterium]